MPSTKHTAADGLSCRPRTASDDADKENKADIDDWIDAELNCVRVWPTRAIQPEEEPLVPGYLDKHMEIARFLTTLQKPSHLSASEYKKFRREATTYLVQECVLFKRASKNMPLQRMIDGDNTRLELIEQMHCKELNGAAHREQEATYRQIADRYWWLNCYKDIKSYVRGCNECQRRDPSRKEEELHPT